MCHPVRLPEFLKLRESLIRTYSDGVFENAIIVPDYEGV
jgi:hypothetical protein